MGAEVRNRFGELLDMFGGILHSSKPQQLVLPFNAIHAFGDLQS